MAAEEEVFITCHTSDATLSDCFSGVFKLRCGPASSSASGHPAIAAARLPQQPAADRRYRDFQVSEIDSKDVVARLQSLEPPRPQQQQQQAEQPRVRVPPLRGVAARGQARSAAPPRTIKVPHGWRDDPPRLCPAQEPCTAEDVPKLVADFAAVAGQDNAQLLAQLLEAALPEVRPAPPGRQGARPPGCASSSRSSPRPAPGRLTNSPVVPRPRRLRPPRWPRRGWCWAPSAARTPGGCAPAAGLARWPLRCRRWQQCTAWLTYLPAALQAVHEFFRRYPKLQHLTSEHTTVEVKAAAQEQQQPLQQQQQQQQQAKDGAASEVAAAGAAPAAAEAAAVSGADAALLDVYATAAAEAEAAAAEQPRAAAATAAGGSGGGTSGGAEQRIRILPKAAAGGACHTTHHRELSWMRSCQLRARQPALLPARPRHPPTHPCPTRRRPAQGPEARPGGRAAAAAAAGRQVGQGRRLGGRPPQVPQVCAVQGEHGHAAGGGAAGPHAALQARHLWLLRWAAGAAWAAGLVAGGLGGWWAGGLVGWWAGGLVGWWAGGLVGWWAGGPVPVPWCLVRWCVPQHCNGQLQQQHGAHSCQPIALLPNPNPAPALPRPAGTKDKRGVTSQWVTAHKVSAQRMAGLNPRLRGVRVGNFEYTDTELRLGMLGGNQFKVRARPGCRRWCLVRWCLGRLRGEGCLGGSQAMVASVDAARWRAEGGRVALHSLAAGASAGGSSSPQRPTCELHRRRPAGAAAQRAACRRAAAGARVRGRARARLHQLLWAAALRHGCAPLPPPPPPPPPPLLLPRLPGSHAVGGAAGHAAASRPWRSPTQGPTSCRAPSRACRRPRRRLGGHAPGGRGAAARPV